MDWCGHHCNTRLSVVLLLPRTVELFDGYRRWHYILEKSEGQTALSNIANHGIHPPDKNQQPKGRKNMTLSKTHRQVRPHETMLILMAMIKKPGEVFLATSETDPSPMPITGFFEPPYNVAIDPICGYQISCFNFGGQRLVVGLEPRDGQIVVRDFEAVGRDLLNWKYLLPGKQLFAFIPVMQ